MTGYGYNEVSSELFSSISMELFDEARQEVLSNPRGVVSRVNFYHTGDDSTTVEYEGVAVIPELPEDSALKVRMMEFLGHQLRQDGFVASMVFATGEAWIADKNDIPQGGRPSDSPLRREVVIVAGKSLSGHNYLGVIGVARDENDHMQYVEDDTDDGADDVEPQEGDMPMLDAFFEGNRTPE